MCSQPYPSRPWILVYVQNKGATRFSAYHKQYYLKILCTQLQCEPCISGITLAYTFYFFSHVTTCNFVWNIKNITEGIPLCGLVADARRDDEDRWLARFYGGNGLRKLVILMVLYHCCSKKREYSIMNKTTTPKIWNQILIIEVHRCTVYRFLFTAFLLLLMYTTLKPRQRDVSATSARRERSANTYSGQTFNLKAL